MSKSWEYQLWVDLHEIIWMWLSIWAQMIDARCSQNDQTKNLMVPVNPYRKLKKKLF